LIHIKSIHQLAKAAIAAAAAVGIGGPGELLLHLRRSRSRLIARQPLRPSFEGMIYIKARIC
jgi:hypothetical protein